MGVHFSSFHLTQRFPGFSTPGAPPLADPVPPADAAIAPRSLLKPRPSAASDGPLEPTTGVAKKKKVAWKGLWDGKGEEFVVVLFDDFDRFSTFFSAFVDVYRFFLIAHHLKLS
jgi:hypothetical protein